MTTTTALKTATFAVVAVIAASALVSLTAHHQAAERAASRPLETAPAVIVKASPVPVVKAMGIETTAVA